MNTQTALRPTPVRNASQRPERVRNALYRFFATDGDIGSLILRLTLALAMFPHGAQKVLGWFGGFGFKGTLAAFTGNGMPLPLALAVMAAEFLGPFALVAGFFTRWSAFGISLVMLGAALMVHAANGFFLNWMGKQAGEGIEYFIPVIAIAVVLMIKGGGRWAADRSIARRFSGNGF
ncbi:MAG: DoxX family protein [Fibrobacteres bacterium]|nr:DoxX family protein [Fibrobacterota bacterium]